jgi:AbrB family looped-hinge helix DNA binding protein
MPEDVEIVVAHQVKKDGTLAAVIPKRIRDALGIGKGTRLVVYGSRGRLIMLPIDKTVQPASGPASDA